MKPSTLFVPFREKVLLSMQISTETMNRKNPRYKFGIWLGTRSNSAECFVGAVEGEFRSAECSSGDADGVFRAREIRRLESQSRWDEEAINSVIGVRASVRSLNSWSSKEARPTLIADVSTVLPYEVARKELYEDSCFDMCPIRFCQKNVGKACTPASSTTMSQSTNSKPAQPCHQSSTSAGITAVVTITMCLSGIIWGVVLALSKGRCASYPLLRFVSVNLCPAPRMQYRGASSMDSE